MLLFIRAFISTSFLITILCFITRPSGENHSDHFYIDIVKFHFLLCGFRILSWLPARGPSSVDIFDSGWGSLAFAQWSLWPNCSYRYAFLCGKPFTSGPVTASPSRSLCHSSCLFAHPRLFCSFAYRFLSVIGLVTSPFLINSCGNPSNSFRSTLRSLILSIFFIASSTFARSISGTIDLSESMLFHCRVIHPLEYVVMVVLTALFNNCFGTISFIRASQIAEVLTRLCF